MSSWPLAYGLTLVVEGSCVLVLWWALGRLRDAGMARALTALWLANLTHPVLWLAGPTGWPALALAEASVTAVEALVYALTVPRRWGRSRWRLASATSLLANAASLGLGLLGSGLGWLR